MNFKDLLLKKIPLKMNGKPVDDTFIKQISVFNLNLLTAFQKKQTQEEMMKSSSALIKASLVDENDKLLMTDNQELAMDGIMEIVDQIIAVNTPSKK